jgi:hypothetical protein
LGIRVPSEFRLNVLLSSGLAT